MTVGPGIDFAFGYAYAQTGPCRVGNVVVRTVRPERNAT